jgi:hypothetical protein
VAAIRPLDGLPPARLAHGRARDLALSQGASRSRIAGHRCRDRDARLRGSLRHLFHAREPGRAGRGERRSLRGARVRRAGRARLQLFRAGRTTE